MKKVIIVLLICLIIAGTIVVSTIGFNVGTKYSENTQISINIGNEFEIKDIKEITNEVFKNKSVLIQQVELYKDMLQITVEEATDEEINELKDKINEKYEINIEISDIDIRNNANVKLREIAKPYLIPLIIITIITILVAVIIYRKLGKLKVLYIMAMSIMVPQVILASIYAVVRIPINRIAPIIFIATYVASLLLSMVHFEKARENQKLKEIK